MSRVTAAPARKQVESTGDKAERQRRYQDRRLNITRQPGDMDDFLSVVSTLAWSQVLARSASAGKPPDLFPAGEHILTCLEGCLDPGEAEE